MESDVVPDLRKLFSHAGGCHCSEPLPKQKKFHLHVIWRRVHGPHQQVQRGWRVCKSESSERGPKEMGLHLESAISMVSAVYFLRDHCRFEGTIDVKNFFVSTPPYSEKTNLTPKVVCSKSCFWPVLMRACANLSKWTQDDHNVRYAITFRYISFCFAKRLFITAWKGLAPCTRRTANV